MIPSMTQPMPPQATAQPPFWLALLAGLPAIASLALMVIPDLGHGHVAVFKSLYLGLCLLWSIPLAVLQRALWRRGLAWWRLLGIVFATTYAMAVANNLVGQLLAIAMGWKRNPAMQWASLLGGLESCWLALLAASAAHAVLAYAYRLHREQAQHLSARAAMRDAELRALRYQLQPHFLFNTLNAAVALVAHRPTAAEEMLVRLADLLRRTLRDGDIEFIPLRSEIDFIRNYLEIQRLRFPDRLSFVIRVDVDVQAAAVPSLILQPLAENAVIHGVAADAERVAVTIDAHRKGPAIEFIVRNSASRQPADRAHTGIGLTNTRERLDALFGTQYSLSLLREDSGEVTARLQIPFIENAQEATPV